MFDGRMGWGGEGWMKAMDGGRLSFVVLLIISSSILFKKNLIGSLKCSSLYLIIHKYGEIFWNSGQKNNSKINWVAWSRMSRHKHAGGLGFRCLRDFNIAL